MAQTFPMALVDFFDKVPIKTFKPDLTEAMEYSRSKGGEIFTADMGPRLWQMDIVVGARHYADMERVRARLNLLRSPGRSLLVHAMPIMAPQYDPTGAILGASAITLDAVAGNNREITLGGFPAGYVLQWGDCLSFTYGSNPIRYAMHQVADQKTADGAGVMANLEVTDFIRPGYALGAAVRLIKPIYKAIVVPGSSEAGTSGDMVTDGLKFSVIQTLGR